MSIMYVWTQKAEDDYRAKHPAGPCKRIAGEEATYDGRPVTGGSFYQAYAMRGWLRKSDIKKPVKLYVNCYKKSPNAPDTSMPPEQRYKRWIILQDWCRQVPKETMSYIAKKMGFKDKSTIYNFCTKYGRDLAKEYGKLPHMNKPNFRKGIWRYIMEQ